MNGLYLHQRKAVDKLRPGSILCGGVGTGKSRTSLAYFTEKICGIEYSSRNKPVHIPEKVPDLYIITTARKRDTLEWEEEMIPFKLSTEEGVGFCKVVVDSWNNIKKYVDVSGAFFIFDEQRLVGSGAWVHAFWKIAKKNKWILLTATPGDTWMDYMPVFVANGFYKNKTEFIRAHVIYSRYVKFPKVERYVNVKELKRNLDSILVPMDYDKTAAQHHEYILVGYDQELYSKAMKSRWNVYEDRPMRNMSELMYVLRRISNSDHRRLDAVSRIVAKHPRAIIFYNFDYELDLLRERFSEIGLLAREWNGHKHEPLPRSSKWVYLVQYTAGSEGWNCTRTDTVIFFSQNYSYRVLTQACGRIDRLNTPYSDLWYYHILSDSDIDKSIRRCLKNKKTFNEKTYLSELESRHNTLPL